MTANANKTREENSYCDIFGTYLLLSLEHTCIHVARLWSQRRVAPCGLYAHTCLATNPCCSLLQLVFCDKIPMSLVTRSE